MSHLLTGSDDGYIRDYDIFSAVNSKNFLTAPQRQHCGVVEGLMKSGQLRGWWENPDGIKPNNAEEDQTLLPVHSLLLQSDALWGLAGTNVSAKTIYLTHYRLGMSTCSPSDMTQDGYVML